MTDNILKKLAGKLAQINLLVVDSDTRIAKLVKEILEHVGFKNVHIASTGAEAIELCRASPVDIIITDWNVEPINGIEFIRYIRTQPDSPNKRMPIIMLTGRAEKPDVIEARDVGVTEFVIKPFNTKALFDRIVQIVEHPRNFVVSRHFKGPDRRRRAAKEAPGASNRRSEKPALPKMFVSAREESEAEGAAERALVVAPDYALKKRLGDEVNINDILRPEVLIESQKIISKTQGMFLDWIAKDFAELELAYLAWVKGKGASYLSLEKIQKVAYGIKCNAGIFGYELASDAARSLFNFCTSKPKDSPATLMIVEKHLDALRGIFQLGIEGNGGKMGTELMDSLRKLLEKYR